MGTADTQMQALKRTSLYSSHVKLGARLVEFGGWEMPVQYSGILEEHRAVREKAGLFDVCHMGEFRVEGPDSLAFLQNLVPNDISRLQPGQALYSQILLPSGGTIDDLLVYYFEPNKYMTVVNASTMENDWTWFNEQAKQFSQLHLQNISDTTGLIALQGPLAQKILQPLTSINLDEISYYHFTSGSVAGSECLISRTGYTGEDGFELYHEAHLTEPLWNALLEAGQKDGLLPAGLGARDTLRLEAGYCLYGHELDETITPQEAGLGWSVKLQKGDFIGRDALQKQREDGLTRKRVGIEMLERGVPRAGYAIYKDGEQVGTLTSGTLGPTLNKNIGMGYVKTAVSEVGSQIEIDIRGKLVPARIVKLPFYTGSIK